MDLGRALPLTHAGYEIVSAFAGVYVIVTVNVAIVPLEPRMTAAAPVAVYEILLHDTTIDVVLTVMLEVVVQVGVCGPTVMAPDRPKQPVSWIVAPPVVAASPYEPALIGVEDESVKAHDGTLCAVAVAPEQSLLTQPLNVRVANVVEVAPSAAVTVPVAVHVTECVAPPVVIENVPVPLPLRTHAVPVTHVTLADAGPAATPNAATRTAIATRLVLANSFMSIVSFPMAYAIDYECVLGYAKL